MKNLLLITIFLFISACAIKNPQDELQDRKLIDASKNEDILLEKGVVKDSSFITDKYPISGEVEILNDQTKVFIPRPKQLFSAASSSEIRLHKLGEIRWVYLGLEPSAAWPMTIEFLENKNNLGLDSFDANSGTINSKIFNFNNIDSKFVFKIERGLQQSSSEIFVSQLKKVNNLSLIHI